MTQACLLYKRYLLYLDQVDDPSSGIENDSDTRLVVISGGHGSDKEIVGGVEREVAYGATSCYSELGQFMDFGFYEQDCRAFGIEPQPDPLIYNTNSGPQFNALKTSRNPHDSPIR